MGRLTRSTLLFALLSAAVGASADDERRDHLRAQTLSHSGKIVPLESIIAPLLAEQPGRLLEVELEEKDDRLVYEIELLHPDGAVWEYIYDPYSGTLLDRYRED